MSDHLERACRSLQKLVRAVAPNEGAASRFRSLPLHRPPFLLMLLWPRASSPSADQYNVWVSRWTGLAAGTMASEDETAAAASLASLTVLLGDRPSEVDFLLHVGGSSSPRVVRPSLSE